MSYLKDITEILPAMSDALSPGSVLNTMKMSPPGEDQVAAYRAERAERHMLRAKYLPETAPPVDLDIVMAMTDVRTILSATYHDAEGFVNLPRRCRRCNHALEAHGGSQVGCGLCDPCPGYAFRFVPPSDKGWSALLASGGEELATQIEGPLWKARDVARNAINDHEHGWLLLAPCPWCEGKSPAMPSGSMTMRVYVPGVATDTYVLCMNPACAPTEEQCGHKKRGRPMWPFHELDWLSDRIDDALERQKMEKLVRNSAA
jgi:hypothetical protein